MFENLIVNKYVYMFKTVGWQPHWLSDGGGGVGVYITHRNIIEIQEKKLEKKIIFFFVINFFFTYLHISKFLLTFAALLE